MIGTKTAGESPLVVVGTGTGVTLIPSPTQLTRLNYFDGKFLRAEDLSAEQGYLRSLVQLSNQAGGAGVVHGFDTRLGAGGALELGPGLAIDRAGRVLFLPHPTSVGVAELIEKSRSPAAGAVAKKGGSALFGGCAEPAAGPPPATSVLPAELYLVVLGHAEALCGEEDVYGKLCEDACSPDTNRRFRVEGVVLRAVPVSLDPPATAFPSAARKHLRSLAASAYFATERARLGREMSGARLRQDLWCHPAPLEHWPTEAGEGIPLALLSVTGGTVEWLDMWTARRDRMEPPPRKGWAWQMMMRPWEVFLAQVLQFQCQLADLLAGAAPGGGSEPCEENRRILERARAILERIERRYDSVVVGQPAQPVGTPVAVAPAPPAAAPAAFAERSGKRAAARQAEVATPAYTQPGQVRPEYLPELAELRKEILVALDEGAPGSARVLVDGGIVELPPAGYLPVVPGREVEEQVRQLLGEGVDLRFCAVRPDYVAHALEEAQHMDRIGLLQGLDDPAKRPEVDVLVPDGEVIEKAAAPAGHMFEVTVRSLLRLPQRAPAQIVDEPAGVAAPPPPAAAAETEHGGADGGGDDGGEGALEGRTLLRGAGRSQRLPGGGGAFHFAGVTAPLGGLASLNAEAARPAYSSLGHDAPETKRTGGAAGFAAAGIRLPELPDLGEAFGRFFGGARTARAASATADEPLLRTHEIHQVETPSNQLLSEITVGVWASVRCDGDPFVLDVGDSTTVRGEAVVAVDGLVLQGEPVRAYARGRVHADLVCREPAVGGSRMRGRLQGVAFGSARGPDDDASAGEEESVPLDLPVELELRPAAARGSELAATLYLPAGDGPVAVTLTTTWRGAPILANSVAAVDLLRTAREQLRTATGEDRARLEEGIREIQAGRIPATFPVVGADARENPALAAPANPFRADAVQALKAVSRALDDPGFREASERLLFGPPPKHQEAARVRATRDWVLFHRRRRSSCDCCPWATIAAPPRRYRVYHGEAGPDTTLENIREALAGSQPPPGPGARLVPLVVEFEGGGATLRTPRAELLDAWRDAMPADAVLFAAIAGAGAGTGDADALLDARLDRVVSVLDDETPLAPAAELDVLDRVPAWLAAGPADGVIVLVTVPRAVKYQEHRVMGVKSGDILAALREAMGSGGGNVQMTRFQGGIWELGYVKFADGTAQADPASLQAVVDAANGSPSQFPPMLATPATATSVQVSQSEAIRTALGALTPTLPEVAPLAGNEAVYGRARAVTVVVDG